MPTNPFSQGFNVVNHPTDLQDVFPREPGGPLTFRRQTLQAIPPASGGLSNQTFLYNDPPPAFSQPFFQEVDPIPPVTRQEEGGFARFFDKLGLDLLAAGEQIAAGFFQGGQQRRSNLHRQKLRELNARADRIDTSGAGAALADAGLTVLSILGASNPITLGPTLALLAARTYQQQRRNLLNKGLSEEDASDQALWNTGVQLFAENVGGRIARGATKLVAGTAKSIAGRIGQKAIEEAGSRALGGFARATLNTRY